MYFWTFFSQERRTDDWNGHTSPFQPACSSAWLSGRFRALWGKTFQIVLLSLPCPPWLQAAVWEVGSTKAEEVGPDAPGPHLPPDPQLGNSLYQRGEQVGHHWWENSHSLHHRLIKYGKLHGPVQVGSAHVAVLSWLAARCPWQRQRQSLRICLQENWAF